LTNVFRNRRAIDILESVEVGLSSAREIADFTGYSASSIRSYLSEQEEAGLLEFEKGENQRKDYCTTEFGSELYDRFTGYEEHLSEFKLEMEEVLDQVSDVLDMDAVGAADNSGFLNSVASDLVNPREYEWDIDTYLDSLEWVAQAEDEREVALTVFDKLRDGRADITRHIQGEWSGLKQLKQELDVSYGLRTAARRMRDKGIIGEMKPEGALVRVTDKGSHLVEKDGIDLESGSSALDALNTSRRRELFRSAVRSSTVEEISDSLGWTSEEVRNNLRYLEKSGLVEKQLSDQKIFQNNSKIVDTALELLDWYEKESAYKRDIRNHSEDISTLFGKIWGEESYESILEMVERLGSGDSLSEVEDSLPEWRNTLVNRLEYFTDSMILEYGPESEFDSNERGERILEVLEGFVQNDEFEDPFELLRWAGSEKKMSLLLDIEGEENYSDAAEKVGEDKAWVEKYAAMFKDRGLVERSGTETDFESIEYTDQGTAYLYFLNNVSGIFEETDPESQSVGSLDELREFGFTSSSNSGNNTEPESPAGSSERGTFSGLDLSDAKRILRDIQEAGEEGLDFTLLDVKHDNPREVVEKLEAHGLIRQEEGREKITNKGREQIKSWEMS
jgi:predicted transcriptional regulator/DNA-binding Lrp family transcriptional regulator